MIALEASASSERIAGSFRDPSGYVFRKCGRIFRAIDGECRETLEFLQQNGVLESLSAKGLIVQTRFVEDTDLLEELRHEHPGYVNYLEHGTIRQITYPYEWSVRMLADAAICTIDLQLALLEYGCSLKDATAYNIQFVNGRPRFIDISSIERPTRLDIWYALGQFQRMFTYPLLLASRYGWDLRSYFLASMDGRDVEQLARAFGWADRLRPSLLMDFSLPLLLTRKANKSSGDGKEILARPSRDPGPQVMNLNRLRRKARKLGSCYRRGGVWADYTATCSYNDLAEQTKKEVVGRYLDEARPQTVLDLGCNTGDYSYIAAEYGAAVLAADGDHDAIDILYDRLQKRPAQISPVVVDILNPSPSIGFRNRERTSFLERAKAECVMALALIHHLLVSGNLSLEAVRDLLYDISCRHVILEYVPTDDAMFRRLIRFRVDLFQDLTLDKCLRVFREKFTVVREDRIAGSSRTLMLLEKRQ